MSEDALNDTDGGSKLLLVEGDAQALRRLLTCQLGPMLFPTGAIVEPRWISVAVGSLECPAGGLIGLTTGAWFSIDLIWLLPSLRRHGLGSAILRKAEQKAAAYGCLGSHVTTTSADASRFYLRNGYVVRLSLPELHPGLTQVTLQKAF